MNITSPVKQGMVYQSCLHLMDTIPDHVTITETFRKILANDQYIWNNLSIPIWRGEPVNVTIGILRASESQGKRNKVVSIYFRVLSGLPAGMLMQLSAPSWWIQKIVSRKLGLFRSGIPATAVDIAGTSFNVRLVTKGDKGSVTWDTISATPAQKRFNKELINARYNNRPCGSSEP